MRTRRWLVVPLALAALAGGAPAQEPPAGGAGAQDDELFTFNVDGAQLSALVDLVTRHTDKIFLFQDRIKTIKIYSKGTRKLSKSALYDVFQSILELNGFALATIAPGTPAEVVKIVDARNMRRYPSPAIDGNKLAKGEATMTTAEEVVTVIYQLQHASAREVSNALRPLLDPNVGGQIIGIEKVESLVITDYAPNVKRLVEVIGLMDTPGPQLQWEVIKLLWADPDDMVSKIGQFMEGQIQAQAQTQGGATQPRVRLVSYARTQSIIVQAIPAHLLQVKELITTLDVKLDYEPSRIHIRKLRHTQSEEMAETVNQILQSVPTLGEGAPDTGASPAPGMPSGPPSPGSGPSRQRPPRSQVGGLSGAEDRPVAIADKTTNSLIVVSSAAEWREIDRIITELDVRRPQVSIHVAIIEVTATGTMNIGVELATIDQPAKNSTRGFTATSFGMSNLVDSNGTPVTPTTPGVPAGRIPSLNTQGVTFGLTRNDAFSIPLLLNLIATDSTTNVLSQPYILTNDNEEGHVKVGESVPTAQLQNVGAAGQLPVQSFQGFQEASLDLTVTPHISEGHYLNLELSLTIDQFTGSSTDPTLPPPKATRELKSRITVPNHQTVVIGGLSSSRLLESVNKVPFLGDIPLLGLLFQRRDTRETRTELFVFITPHILEDPEFRDLGKLSAAELEAVRKQGLDPGRIDAAYRAAFADQDWPGAAEGLPASRVRYRGLHED